MLEERIKKEGLSTALVSECINKQYQWQLSAQEVFDSMFYKYLFDGRVINREFAIKSPFESYASSGGKYIVDTDCWKLKEEDVVYTGLLEFNDNKDIPYMIVKIAKEIFPDIEVSVCADYCHLNIPRNKDKC